MLGFPSDMPGQLAVGAGVTKLQEHSSRGLVTLMQQACSSSVCQALSRRSTPLLLRGRQHFADWIEAMSRPGSRWSLHPGQGAAWPCLAPASACLLGKGKLRVSSMRR